MSSIRYENVRRGDVYRYVYQTPEGEVPRRFVVVDSHSCYVFVAPKDRLPDISVDILQDASIFEDVDLELLIPDPDAVEKFTDSRFSRRFEEVSE
jgi:hypothetical protein